MDKDVMPPHPQIRIKWRTRVAAASSSHQPPPGTQPNSDAEEAQEAGAPIANARRVQMGATSEFRSETEVVQELMEQALDFFA